MSFKDHFSDVAAGYAQHRPDYPEPLFDWLAAQVEEHDHAWDCATGNGQAARHLTRHFDKVTATDASAAQIAKAESQDGITFRVASAEDSGLPDASVSLVTVATAAHWFDHDAFHREVRRVAKLHGVAAVWCYGMLRIDPEIDAVVDDYYDHTLAGYWPVERRYVDEAYAGLPFPFKRLDPPEFGIERTLGIKDLIGYLGSWSGTAAYRRETGNDPFPALAARLETAWSGKHERLPSKAPIHLLAGKVFNHA